MLAYYTCFLGGNYNTDIDQPNWSYLPAPPVPSTEHDCYFFTNNPTMYSLLENTGWKRQWLDIPIYNDSVKDRMSTKELRTCAHRFPVLEKYEWLCWFDNKVRIDHEKVKELVQTSEKSIVLCKHVQQFPTVWGEFELAMGYNHYAKQREQNVTYINRKLAEGFKESIDIHYCVTFMLLKISDPVVTEFGEEWFRNIEECGIECQISLQFVHPKYAESIHTIPYQYCWTYNFT